MHDLPVSRQNLRCPNPFPLGEVRWHREILVHVVTRRHRELFADIEHDVRLPELPPVIERRLRRQIFRFSLGRPAIHPGLDRFKLLGGESRIVGKMSDARICEPGWHLARHHRLADRFRPWPGGLVIEKGHRSHLARSMTTGTALIKDRRHVFRESGGRKRVGSRNKAQSRNPHILALPRGGIFAYPTSIGEAWTTPRGYPEISMRQWP